MPTFDLSAFLQRISKMIIMGMILRSVLFIMSTMFKAFKTPLALGAIVIMLAYYPDVIQWVLMKIGDLQMKCFAILLNAVMPDIFSSMGTQVTSWRQIWQTGLGILPTNLVSVLNAVGVAELMGLVTATLTAGSTVILYRKVLTRIGI